MTLTWKDIRSIVQISNNLLNSLDYDKIKKMGEEGYFTEILNTYNKRQGAAEKDILDSMIEAMAEVSDVEKEQILGDSRNNDLVLPGI